MSPGSQWEVVQLLRYLFKYIMWKILQGVPDKRTFLRFRVLDQNVPEIVLGILNSPLWSKWSIIFLTVQNLKFRKVLFSGDTLYSIYSASTLNFTERFNTAQSTACTPLRSARGWTSPSSPSVPPPSTCSTPAPPSTCSRASPGSSTCRLVRLSGEVRRRGEGRRVLRRRRRRKERKTRRRIASSLTNFYSKVKEKDRFGIPLRTFTSWACAIYVHAYNSVAQWSLSLKLKNIKCYDERWLPHYSVTIPIALMHS